MQYFTSWVVGGILSCRLGDLGELAKHGSLHQYLLHLHKNGEVPITSFWWGKTKTVSVCSPQAFKELAGLVDRPGESERGVLSSP